MYLNSIICLIIFVLGFYTFVYIARKNKGNYTDISYAVFWLFVSLTWLFFSISLILFKLNHISLALFINQYIVQTFALFQLVAPSYYASFRLTNNKKIASVALFFYFLFSFVCLYFNYLPGSVYLTRSTYYSFEYAINPVYWILFQYLFAAIILATLGDFIKGLYYWFKKSNFFEPKYFFSSLSLIVYGMIGYLEEGSVSATWISLLFRLSIILCIYVAYLAYSDKENE